jgi:hypothetical protein
MTERLYEARMRLMEASEWEDGSGDKNQSQ